jgi:hypothetical protein
MLSSDAAHPSILALSRYVVSDQLGDPRFDHEPGVVPEEMEETYYYLAFACVGVCIGVNQLLGGNKGGQALKELVERHSALSSLAAMAG